MKDETIKRQAVKNLPKLILLAVFIFGMLCGVLILKNVSFNLSKANALKLDGSFLSVLVSSFLKELVFLLLPYMCGYGAVFQFVPFLLLLYKGLGFGYYLSLLYLSYGFRGIVYSALAVVLPTLLLIFVIITACRESIKLSNLFFKSFSSNNHLRVELETIKLYNIKFLLLLLFLFCFSLLTAVCHLLFSGILKV